MTTRKDIARQSHDLPTLTHKQGKFVDNILKGMTQSAAYRDAYDCDRSAPRTVWREASLLSTHPKVSQWLDWARAMQASEADCTLENHLMTLAQIRDQAIEAQQFSAAHGAEKTRGLAAGLHVKRNVHADVNLNDLYDQIAGKNRTKLVKTDTAKVIDGNVIDDTESDQSD